MVLSAALKRVVRPVTGTGPLYRRNEQTKFVSNFGESIKLYTRHDGYRSSSSNWVGAIQFNCLVILEYQTDVRRCSFEYEPGSLL